MEGIQVSVSKVGPQDKISQIKVGGYIDTTTSAEVERALDGLVRKGDYNIIIELGNVDYISSAGWGIFISEIKGIRERGGDLKLANMIPDVYEVFELLEFHYILRAYDTIEEASRDFNLNSDKSLQDPDTIDQVDDANYDDLEKQAKQEPAAKSVSAPSINSTEDKIKKIIIDNPDLGFLEIKKTLNSEIYNFTKIGVIDTWKYLKKMGLTSKKKRMEFFKSKAFQT
ncbi:STAS domain-containing protein [candidate division KSB1 bacterium]|nr:STAS domain-containing protein [candidate division KSB1 bacterium]